MSAIYKRELKAYFTSPLAYVVLGVFFFFAGLFFSFLFGYGSADVASVFGQMFTISLFVIPILTMRLMSEDKKQKTDQVLLTAPVRLSGIVLGKFFAAFTVFGIAISPMLIFQIIVSGFAEKVDWLLFIGNIVGILLLGGSLIAVGLFISALTESQVVAAVGSFAVSLFLILITSLSQMVSSIGFLVAVFDWISFSERYNSFTQGVFDYSNFVFFLSVAAIFLFAGVRVLEKKRWS
jgi:ABC-2 type transport system permease protein